MSLSSNIRAGAAYVEVTAETSKLQRNLKTAQAELQSFGRSCVSIGKDLLMVSGAMAAPMVFAVKTFAAFDDQMRQVKGVTGATGKQFEALTEQAKKLGRETSFTAQQVAEGMAGLGRMGFKPQEIEAAIPAVMNLARATGTDLAEASQIASNNLKVFGMNASQMGEVSDIMAATANNSAQTLTDLGEALKMAGPKAAEAGQSLKETCVQLGILANMGIRGSMAGTALSRTFQQMASSDVQAVLKRYQVDAVDATGKLRNMRDILTDLAKATANLPNAEKIALFQKIFDIRGSLGGGVLTANIDQIEQMGQVLDNCTGVAEKTAKEMDGGLGGAFRNLSSAAEGVQICFGEIINNGLVPLIKSISSALLSMRDWMKEHPILIELLAKGTVVLAAFSAGLIALGITSKAVAAGMGVMSVAVKAASVAMALFNATNPVGWCILAAGAIAGLMIAFNGLAGEVKQTASAMGELLDKNDQARQLDAQRADRLKQLADKQKLSNAEAAEAQTIISELSSRYGDMGASLDTMTGKLDFAASAQEKLNRAMAEAAVADIDKAIGEHKTNVDTAQGYNDTMSNYWHRVNHPLDETASLWGGGTIGKIDQNGKYMQAQLDEIAKLQARKQALLKGLQGNAAGQPKPGAAPTGTPTTPHVTVDERDDAEKKATDIENRYSRDRRNSLENEIADIQAMNSEYKKLLQTMLDFEKAKPEKLQDSQKIAELEKKLQQADGIAAERIANAQAQAAEKFNRDVANLERRFADTEQSIQQKRDEQAQDRKIDDTLKTDPNAGIEMLQGMIEEYRSAAQAAKDQFQKELEAAQADGQITDDERNRLNNAQDGYGQAESMLDKYESKLRDAQDGTQKTAENLKPQGAFLAAALDGILGGSSADRTAKATELIATNTKKTNEYLKKGVQTTFG